jgi:hypothetical protein
VRRNCRYKENGSRPPLYKAEPFHQKLNNLILQSLAFKILYKIIDFFSGLSHEKSFQRFEVKVIENV